MSSSRLDPRVARTLIAVIVGAVAVILDSTIVSVALQPLATDLHADVATIQWVSTAYLLALGVVVPTVAWLQGLLGGRRLWIVALAIFLLGSVLCACAWDAGSLIAFRVIQGLGGGILMPLMTTIVMQAAQGRDLGRIVSIIAVPTAVGPIVGPVIGGLILGAGDWRWLFLVNVPLCVVGLVLAALLLPRDAAMPRTRLDVVGLVLLSPALVALLWGLANVTGDGGFGRTDVLVPLAAGGVLLLAFLGWALRRRERALLDLAVLRSRPAWAATVLLFLSGAALYGAMLLLPLYWQELRGADALGAGLLLIPQGVGSLLSRMVTPRLQDRIGARGVAILGFTLVALSTVPFAFAGSDTSVTMLLATLFLRGFGLGLVIIPLMMVAFVGLDSALVPHASIITRIAQQIGGSVGVALLAVILATGTQATGSTAQGFDAAFWWSIGFAGVATVLSLVVPGRRAIAALTAQPGPMVALAEDG